jgi:glucose/arabinose dehydrogenase
MLPRPIAIVVLLLGALPANAELDAQKIMTAARPTTLVSPPADSRLFVVEQLSGKVKILDAGVVQPTPFLTIDPNTMNLGISTGFLGMAFDPDHAVNVRFYTYSIQGEPVLEQDDRAYDPGRVVVRRYHVSENPDLADASSGVDILSFDNWSFGHNAGWIGFNPKLSPADPQYLYIATGDGGDFNDACFGPCPTLDPDPALIGWARDLTNNLHGKILRIDVDVPAMNSYAIPSDNPYVLSPEDDEIWAFGLRNPTGTGFDLATGDLYIGDIGQGAWEEVDLIPAGSAGGINLGWRLREGTSQTAGSVGGPKPPGAVDPIYEYDHDFGDPTKGLAVIGGRVYRGSITSLQGKYVFGDWLGRIWAITPNPEGDLPAAFDGTNFSNFEDLTAQLAPSEGFGRLQGFGEDAFGELYILENCDPSELVSSVCPDTAVDGGVYKIVEVSPVSGLSAVGAFGLISALIATPLGARRRIRGTRL